VTISTGAMRVFGAVRRCVPRLAQLCPRWPSAVRLRTLGTSATEVDQGLFALDQDFVSSYQLQRPPFGFGGLGEMVYFRTYSRNKPDGAKERWADTVERVVNGSFRLQQEWAQQEQRAWNEAHAQRTAQDMFERIFTMKFTPPGRGLWAMGTAITEDKKLYAALNNCAFVSTAEMADDPTAPFCFLMDASMLGVGVGFDTHGAGLVRVQAQRASNGACDVQFVVPDSREGWVESVRLLLLEYFGPGEQAGPCSITFDYSSIRAAGLPVRGPAAPSPSPPLLARIFRPPTSPPCAPPTLTSSY